MRILLEAEAGERRAPRADHETRVRVQDSAHSERPGWRRIEADDSSFALLMDRLSTYRDFEQRANACSEGECRVGLG